MPITRAYFSIACLLVLVIGCGDDDDAPGRQPPSLSVDAPLVEEPPVAGNGIVFIGTTFDLGDVGYMQEEFFVTGTARSFTNVGALDSDGNWQVEEASTADYKTRILVHRPIDPADFGGTVLVEWLNVSAGFDSAPDWIYGHVEMIRSGYVWVGVSAQKVGIDGPPGGSLIGIDFSLKNFDPVRYGSLLHPGDSYSYDIYSQIGRAMHDRNGVDPLRGLSPGIVIAAGESQSAFRLTTYVNAFAGTAQLFDGYLIHSRGGGAAPLSQSPQTQVDAPGVLRIRTDLDFPVLTFQSETDLTLLRAAPDRQDDSRNFRWWEVAGTAHADVYTLLLGMGDQGDDPSVAELVVTNAPIPGIIECDSPINSGPHHFVLKAGLRALERWVRDGIAPPSSPRLELAGDPPDFVRDELGNAIGGIRTSYVDVPTAQLTGDSPGGSAFCFLFGQTIPFDQATLDELYPDHDTYVNAVAASTQAAVDAGFLLPPDAALITEAAETSDIGG